MSLKHYQGHVKINWFQQGGHVKKKIRVPKIPPVELNLNNQQSLSDVNVFGGLFQHYEYYINTTNAANKYKLQVIFPFWQVAV